MFPPPFFIPVNKKACIVIVLLLALLLTGCSQPNATVLSEQYKYDDKGRLIEKIAPDGGKTSFKYNKQGLPAEVKYPKGFVRYGYDADGNRIWMQNKAGRTEYKYDAFDRLIEVIFKYSPEKKIRYGYDPWNRISSIAILENDRLDYKVEYEYDILGNLKSVDDGNGQVEYNYYPEKGQIIRHFPNGIKTVSSYSPLGELTSLNHSDSQNKLIASYSYEYDPPGKLSRVIEKTPEGIKTTRYEWNNRGYLKALHQPDGNSIRYEYNAMGNRISMTDFQSTITYKYNNFGRPVKSGNTKYEWDSNGNLTSIIEKGEKTRIRYDGRGLPVLIRTPDRTIHYKWDGDGNMISKRIGKDISHYLPNPLTSSGFNLAEYGKTEKMSTVYIYGNTLVGQRNTQGSMNYFLEDGFNSIRHITDMHGKIRGHQDYTPFGEPMLIKGDKIVNLRMAGKRFLPKKKIGTFEQQTVRWAISKGLKGFSKYAFKHGYADYGKRWGPLFGKLYGIKGLEHGKRFGAVVTGILDPVLLWTDLWTAERERVLQGVQHRSADFWEDWGRSGLGMMSSLAGGYIGGSTGSLIGGYVGTAVGEGTAAISRFYGSRMNRPYWWWSPMKWMPEEEFIGRSEEQNKRQATLAAQVSKTRDRTRESYNNVKRSNNVDNWSNRSLLITDLGINQYDKNEDELPFVNERHIIFRLPSANSDDPSYYKSYETVKQEAYVAVMNYYKENQNVENLELRVLQDVNTMGYLTGDLKRSEAQERADKFTEAFLEGINQIKKELGLTTIGLFASNGGKTFTHGTLSQLSKGNRPLDYMYFDDAQLKANVAEKLIKAIGVERIGFLVVRGGFHGSIGGVRTRGNLVANPRVAKELAQKYDGVELYYFNPPGPFDRPLGLGVGEDRHIYITSHAKKPIQTKIYNSKTKKYREYKEMTLISIIQKKIQRINSSGRRDDDDGNDEKRAKSKKEKYKDNERKYHHSCPWCGGGGPPPPPGGGDLFDDDDDDDDDPPPGGGPFGDGGGGSGGGFYDPFKSVEANLGGIKLDATAQFTGNSGNIKGVVYDPEKQIMVLVSDDGKDRFFPPIKPEDLAVALMTVFGPIPQDPQFSLDPDDPKNPRGKWLKAVYMPEQIIGGTEFGKTLFEADWLLKQYAFGVAIDETTKRMHERKSSVTGFKSTKDLMFEKCFTRQEYKDFLEKFPHAQRALELPKRSKNNNLCINLDKISDDKKKKLGKEAFNEIIKYALFSSKDQTQGKEKWARYWIVSDEMKLKRSGNSIYFDVAKMRVKSKKQVPDPSSPTGLRDVDAEDPISTKFANLFTELYDDIAKESPEFERVRQLAKAVAIAKWIKQENIPFDRNWVNEYANKRIKTTGKITAISTQWEMEGKIPFQEGNQVGIQTVTRRLHLFGGVDLTVNPKYISDDGITQSLKKAVITRLKEKGTGTVFNVQTKGKKLQAVILPITRSGQEMWKNSPVINKRGIDYQFDNRGDVRRSIDNLGNSTDYAYDSNNRLKAIKVTAANGWAVFAERDGNGSIWTITNPRGNEISYKYRDSGYLSEVKADGKKIASYDYNPKRKQVKIHYQKYIESISYDNNGYIKEYKVQRKTKKGLTEKEAERLSFSYDNSNNITRINGAGIGQLSISYSKDGSRPMAIRTPQAEINYTYDSNYRIKDIYFPEGRSIHYFYNGENIEKISFKNGSKQAEFLFDGGNVVKVKDFLGGNSEYKYSKENLLADVTDPRSAKTEYSYDEKNRIREIKLPDGRWIEYQYRERPTKGKESSSPVQILTVITHASSKYVKEVSSRQKSTTILRSRLDDIKEASRDLKNGLIIDLFVERKGTVHTNIVDATGNIHKVDAETAKEFRRLLKYTSKTKGKLGRTLLSRWQKFYDTNLLDLNTAILWKSPDGKTVKLKPVLIIKSNEVTYKYANLEKVPVLADNFTIFIASKTKEAKNVSETSAKELVSKINNIPKINRENIVFVIRLPAMNKSEQEKWQQEIGELREVIGEQNVLFNPSKNEFNKMLQRRGKDIIAVELTHTSKGVLLKNNERYTLLRPTKPSPFLGV